MNAAGWRVALAFVSLPVLAQASPEPTRVRWSDAGGHTGAFLDGDMTLVAHVSPEGVVGLLLDLPDGRRTVVGADEGEMASRLAGARELAAGTGVRPPRPSSAPRERAEAPQARGKEPRPHDSGQGSGARGSSSVGRGVPGWSEDSAGGLVQASWRMDGDLVGVFARCRGACRWRGGAGGADGLAWLVGYRRGEAGTVVVTWWDGERARTLGDGGVTEDPVARERLAGVVAALEARGEELWGHRQAGAARTSR